VEDRTLLSTFLVTNTADSGPGSLRQAIIDSNGATGQTNTIDFALPGQGVHTISPLSPLPAITQSVLVDGQSQPAYAGTPLIQIGGSQSGGGDGLTITGSDVAVRGLDITNFSEGAGLLISGTGATGNVITANDLGTDPTGSQPVPNYFGVRILAGAHDNLVGGTISSAGNLIAFNIGPGVSVEGDGTVGNRVTANRIFANDVPPTPTPAGMLQFNGSSYVRLLQDLINYDIARPVSVNGTSHTIEAWFQTTTGGVILGIQSTDPSANPVDVAGPLLYVGSDGKLYGVYGGWSQLSPISSDATVNDGRWHQVALVLGIQGLTLFLDGQIVGSTSGHSDNYYTQIGTGYTDASDPATPGGWYGFRGQIDDVRVWSVARSVDEIRQDMATPLTGSEPNLDAYYPFDEGQGLTAHDLSPNHRDATLAGTNGHLPTWSSSSGLAIDLGDDGVTYDSTSPRQGPNNFQNYPIIVTTADGRLQGSLYGEMPNTSYHVDFFASAGFAPGGAGQAEVYLGSLEVTTDGQGQSVFDVPFSPPAGKPIVNATSTDPQGDTSELSAQRRVSLEAPVQTMRLVSGQPLGFSAAAGNVITLHDPDAAPLDPAWELTLSVTAGTLQLSKIDGLIGSGDGTGTLHYRGSLTALNAALEGLRITPPSDFHGNTALSLDAESAGATPLQTRVLISDGQFLVTTTADSGPGSLRQAILASDAATGGTNTIDFAIAGPGVQTIALASPLPAITNPVLIDGSSQPGCSGTPLVAIDASSSGMADGLTITGSSITVRGLATGGFALGTANLADGLTLQSGPLQANHGADAVRVDTYRIDTTGDGRLVVQLHSSGLIARLLLLDAQGRPLVESDGLSLTSSDNVIDQHLSAGTYFLNVAGSGGAGDWGLTATLTPASAPFQAIPVGLKYFGGGLLSLVGDFNSDGIPDLAATDGVHLGVGDGTFREPLASLGLSAVNPQSVNAMVSGDFNGDGKLDLVAEDSIGVIAVLLGNGDGTFQAPKLLAGGGGFPCPLVAGDFNGDGKLDLATTTTSGDIAVLLGNGDGTFQAPKTFAVGSNPYALVTGDFNGDGKLDLAVADAGAFHFQQGSGPGDISLLLGNGDGTFQPSVAYAAGLHPDDLVAGDFNGDGKLDLAVADGGVSFVNGIGVSVLRGNGDGTFQPAREYATGNNPSSLVAGDFRGDGRLDLAVTDSEGVQILLGNGDGAFQPAQTVSVLRGGLVAGDFSGDARLDLAVSFSSGSVGGSAISVLLSNGDGTFTEKEQPAAVGKPGAKPLSMVVADFNGDGRPDLATANWRRQPNISVLLGNGDGTFQPQVIYAVGSDPSEIVAGDFNSDGRIDLAVADSGSNAVSVLLGNGDGTFQPAVEYAAGNRPGGLVAGDFNGDGKLDLAVADQEDVNGNGFGVSVLLGNGDGTFQPAVEYAAGNIPGDLVAGDFNGDGKLDLAVADGGDANGNGSGVSVLLGNGDGTFQAPKFTAVPGVGSLPAPIVAGDFNGDGKLDLTTTGYDPGPEVSVLLGNGDGTFQAPTIFETPASWLVAGDFRGDGRLDLAITSYVGNTVSVLTGNGDGTFQPAKTFAVGSGTSGGRQSVFGLVARDFNGDGKLDLAVANVDFGISTRAQLRLLLGNGDGTFTDPGQLATTLHATPLVADANGDGTDDVLVVDGAGNILYRQGVPGQAGSFEPPITVNPGFPSRDIAWVTNTDQGPVLASVDAHDDAVSFYAWRNGAFVRLGSVTTGRLPAQIIAADSTGDGQTDLVVRNAGDGTLSVFYGTAFDRSKFNGPINPQFVAPSFLPPLTLPVGIGVSDVQAIETNGTGAFDLVITNKLSGQVSILHNLGSGTFAPPEPYRAGTGLSAVDPTSSPQVTSLEATAGVAAAPITTRGGPTSLVTMNPGSNTMDVLAGLGQGRFANPVAIQTQSPAQVVRVADFNHDGIPDLAVLTANGASIYLGNGKGGFSSPVTYDAGPEASGLTIADVNHDGSPDLLLGNPYGDVLVLLGQSDGTFRPYREANQTIALAVADLTGNGSKDVIYADQALDRVVVDYGAGGSSVLGDHATGLLSPGAVKLADLNGDGIPDLIVANSGSNNVLVYPGLGNGQFGPAINGGNGYFVGTNPVGITVADLTGQTWATGQPRIDLVVADKGSNQVSILLNNSQPGGAISFDQGPRLNSGGIGPVSTVVGHFTSSLYQDILVSNSGSNNVALLPGVGGGFFNDTNPQKFPVGDNPGPLFVGNFDGRPDLVTVNAGSNDLTLISDFMTADHVTSTISSGGTDPDTAFSFSASSGFDDLVVGNGGDGVLALFEGGDQGLTLTSSQTNPDLPSPSAVVYAGLAGGDVQFYAASAGREAAALVALSLGGEIAPLASPAAPATPVVPQLIPLQESSVTLVGTLLITALPSSEAEVSMARAETEVAATVSQSSSAPVAPNQSVLVESRTDESGGGEELPAQPQAAKGEVQAPDTSWQRHVLGTDEAIERFDRDHPDLFQPRRDNSPQTNPPQGEAHPAEPDRLEAIDQAIEDVTDRRVGETHQEFNHIKIQTVGCTHPTELQAIEDVSDRRVGETHQELNHIKIQTVGCTHPTELQAIEDVTDRRVGETHQEFNHIKIQTVGCTHPSMKARRSSSG
jgi:hypothetical protein